MKLYLFAIVLFVTSGCASNTPLSPTWRDQSGIKVNDFISAQTADNITGLVTRCMDVSCLASSKIERACRYIELIGFNQSYDDVDALYAVQCCVAPQELLLYLTNEDKVVDVRDIFVDGPSCEGDGQR